MPIELKKTRRPADEEENAGLSLFNESGETTLVGDTVANFLEGCDFTHVAQSPDAQAFLVIAEDGDEEEDAEETPNGEADGEDDEEGEAEDGDEEDDGEEEGEEAEDSSESVDVLLPGAVVARLVNEDDLVDMFGYYLGRMAAEVDESDETMLEERAALACFDDYFDDEGIAENQRDAIAEMLREVLVSGVVTAEIDEKFLSKGQRLKVSRLRKKPKTGARKRALKKRRREEGRGAKKQKIQRQKKMFKRKRASRLKVLARESFDESLLLGGGEGIDGAAFRVAVTEAPDLTFDYDTRIVIETQCGITATCPDEDCGHVGAVSTFLVDEKKSKVPPQFLSKQKGKKGKKKDADGDYDGSKEGEKCEAVELLCPECLETFSSDGAAIDPDVTDHDADSPERRTKRPASESAGPFSTVAGRPSLNEGSTLAARTLASMGVGVTTLDEDGGN